MGAGQSSNMLTMILRQHSRQTKAEQQAWFVGVLNKSTPLMTLWLWFGFRVSAECTLCSMRLKK